MELIKRYTIKERLKQDPISMPEDVKSFLLPCFSSEKEFFIGLFLDNRNKVICREIIHIGTINATFVEPASIFRNAIKLNSNRIILAHNHPSGDLEPSDEDISIGKTLRKCGEILNIKVLDQLVFNFKDMKSYNEEVL